MKLFSKKQIVLFVGLLFVLTGKPLIIKNDLKGVTFECNVLDVRGKRSKCIVKFNREKFFKKNSIKKIIICLKRTIDPESKNEWIVTCIRPACNLETHISTSAGQSQTDITFEIRPGQTFKTFKKPCLIVNCMHPTSICE